MVQGFFDLEPAALPRARFLPCWSLSGRKVCFPRRLPIWLTLEFLKRFPLIHFPATPCCIRGRAKLFGAWVKTASTTMDVALTFTLLVMMPFGKFLN